MILLVGGMVLVAGQLAIRAMRVTPTKPPYAMLGAATLTLAGVVIFVDLPLAVGLLFQQTGLWRHAAALTTGVAAANWLAISAARLTALRRSRRIPQTTTA